jgi:hypothetical protein
MKSLARRLGNRSCEEGRKGVGVVAERGMRNAKCRWRTIKFRLQSDKRVIVAQVGSGGAALLALLLALLSGW